MACSLPLNISSLHLAWRASIIHTEVVAIKDPANQRRAEGPGRHRESALRPGGGGGGGRFEERIREDRRHYRMWWPTVEDVRRYEGVCTKHMEQDEAAAVRLSPCVPSDQGFKLTAYWSVLEQESNPIYSSKVQTQPQLWKWNNVTGQSSVAVSQLLEYLEKLYTIRKWFNVDVVNIIIHATLAIE